MAGGASAEAAAKNAAAAEKAVRRCSRTSRTMPPQPPRSTRSSKEETEKLTDGGAQGTGRAGGTRQRQQIKMVLTPWFRHFLTYDPAPVLEKVKCPVLAINGEKDLQVDPKQNLPPIEAALKAGGNADFTLKELPGLNHLFQACKTGAISEYQSDRGDD